MRHDILHVGFVDKCFAIIETNKLFQLPTEVPLKKYNELPKMYNLKPLIIW